MTEQPDGNVLVEATVADTGQLCWWLLGFGGRVEVLESTKLLDEMHKLASKMISKYGVGVNNA